MNKLRYLSFDDLFLLRYLSDGHSLTTAAKELGLTQPAVTQRIRKMEGLFGFPIYLKAGRRIEITREGAALCQKAIDALALMTDVSAEKNDLVVRIGTRPEAGRSWLWPAINVLRTKAPHITYHVNFGSGSEILAQLGVEKLDCALTSAPLTSKHFRAIELSQEDYVFVARPDIAKQINKASDLNDHVLIEHDRSFPLTRYVNSKDKAKISYRDVWFLESTEIMAEAIAEGYGVGVIPDYIAQRFFAKKRLAPLKLNTKLANDHFRLIYRATQSLDEPFQLLAQELQRQGLR